MMNSREVENAVSSHFLFYQHLLFIFSRLFFEYLILLVKQDKLTMKVSLLFPTCTFTMHVSIRQHFH